jgi:hypothetical protein
LIPKHLRAIPTAEELERMRQERGRPLIEVLADEPAIAEPSIPEAARVAELLGAWRRILRPSIERGQAELNLDQLLELDDFLRYAVARLSQPPTKN